MDAGEPVATPRLGDGSTERLLRSAARRIPGQRSWVNAGTQPCLHPKASGVRLRWAVRLAVAKAGARDPLSSAANRRGNADCVKFLEDGGLRVTRPSRSRCPG